MLSEENSWHWPLARRLSECEQGDGGWSGRAGSRSSHWSTSRTLVHHDSVSRTVTDVESTRSQSDRSTANHRRSAAHTDRQTHIHTDTHTDTHTYRQSTANHRQSWKSGHFQKLSPPLTMGASNWPLILNWGTIRKSYRGWIFDICPSFFCHMTLNLAETSVVKSRPSVPYEADFFKSAFKSPSASDCVLGLF